MQPPQYTPTHDSVLLVRLDGVIYFQFQIFLHACTHASRLRAILICCRRAHRASGTQKLFLLEPEPGVKFDYMCLKWVGGRILQPG